MKTNITFVIFACVLMVAAREGFCESKLKVGVILPLSGDFSAFGTACQNGIKLAQEELGADAENHVELIFENDELFPRKAVDAFQNLRTTKVIDAVITFASGSSNAVAPLAESSHVAMLAIAASDPKVVEGRDHVFSLWVSPRTEAKVAIKEAKSRGYKRIARIGTLQEGVIAIKKAFDAQSDGSFDILLDEEYPPSEKDYRSYVAKLRNQSKLDAVFSILMPGHNGIFAKQLRQQGITCPIFGVETLEDPNDVKTAEGALTGAWYVQSADPSDQFAARMEEKFPGTSLYASPHCHDAVYLLVDAAKKGGDVTKYLSTLKDFKGALGTFSAIKGGHFSLPAGIKVVTPEGFKQIRTE